MRIGRSPSGLRAPAWWTPDGAPITLPGRVLGTVGLIDPPLNPDQAVLYMVTAVD